MKRLFNKFDIFFLLLLGLAYFFLVHLYVGPVEDIQYTYCRYHGQSLFDSPISSFWDSVISQLSDYVTVNGRFFVHVVVQYLCGMAWGRTVFFILSTFIFVCVIAGMLILIRRKYTRRGEDLFIVLILFMTIVPSPGRTVLGHIAFTINYLWVSSAIVWFLIFLDYLKNGLICKKNCRNLLYVYAFFVGSLHEGFSIPLSGALIVCYFFDLNGFRKIPIPYLSAFILGTCIVTFAPSNFIRVINPDYVGAEPYGIIKIMRKCLFMIRTQATVQVLSVLCLAFLFMYKSFISFITQHVVELLTAIFTVLFALFVAYVGEHQLMPITLYVTLISVGLYYRFADKIKLSVVYVMCTILVLGMIFSYTKIYSSRQQLIYAWESLIQSARNKNTDYALGKELYELDRSMNSHFAKYTDIRSCMMHMTDKHYFERLVAVLATDGKQPEKLMGILPDTKENILSFCTSQNRVSPIMYKAKSFFILKQPEAISSEVYKLSFTYNQSIIASKLHKKPKVETYNVLTNAHSFIEGDNKYTIVFLSPSKINIVQ